MKHYIHESKQFSFGIILLISTAFIPILNAIRIFFNLPDFTDSSSILYFFYKMGPFSLGVSGLFSLINSYFLLKTKSTTLWYVQLISITFVGINDSVGAIFFYKFSDYDKLVIFLPLAVTILQWLGLGLVKSDVFKKTAY